MWRRQLTVRAMRKMVTSVGLAIVAVVIVKSLPDVARYLKMRGM
jgi:hypothetical protein